MIKCTIVLFEKDSDILLNDVNNDNDKLKL